MKKLLRVLVTHQIPNAGISLLKKAGFNVKVNNANNQVVTHQWLRRQVKGVAGLLTDLTDTVDATVFNAAGPQLKVVANYAVGYNNIDVIEAKKRGVVVGNTPGKFLTMAVAEHTMALTLAITRRIVEADKFMRAGKYHEWSPTLDLGPMLSGMTFGIIGLGRIGKEVARRAIGLGMKIIYTSGKRELDFEQGSGAVYKKNLRDLLHAADVVSIHVPLLSTTHHLINASSFRIMKPTSYLINTSRGPVVDEAALAQAIKQRMIAGAALDVFEFEPKVHPILLKAENVILTPHIASATHEARDEMAVMAARNIIAVLRGKPAPYAVAEMKNH